MSAKLEKVMTIPEVATLAGWSRRRMLRHLLRLDAQADGRLLRNIGTEARPRYTVTLAVLQNVAPQWFNDPETLHAQLEEMREEVTRLKRVVEMHTARLVALAAGR